MDVRSANSCQERWVILRIPGIQQDATPASLLQFLFFFYLGGVKGPQIAQPTAGHSVLHPQSKRSDSVVHRVHLNQQFIP